MSGECFLGTCCSESTGSLCRGCGLASRPGGGLHGWLHKSLLGLLFCFLFFSSIFHSSSRILDSLLVAEQLQAPHNNCVMHKRSPPLWWISFRSKHASFSEYPSECLLAPPSGFLNHCVQHGAGVTLSLESGVEMASLRCGASCTGVECGGKPGPSGKSEGGWQVGTNSHVPTPQKVNPRTHPLLALRQASAQRDVLEP